MTNILIYLDNCCFNRPFDDQTQLKIRIETEAKLFLQEKVKAGEIDMVWSFMLELENDRNPFEEKRCLIAPWKRLAKTHVPALPEVKVIARDLISDFRLQTADAAHVACAIFAKAHYFVTTDTSLIKAMASYTGIKAINPVDWFEETEHD